MKNPFFSILSAVEMLAQTIFSVRVLLGSAILEFICSSFPLLLGWSMNCCMKSCSVRVPIVSSTCLTRRVFWARSWGGAVSLRLISRNLLALVSRWSKYVGVSVVM